jgi:lysophospholipase L1-like esterase
VRACPIGDTLVDGNGAPRVGVTVTAQLFAPAGSYPVTTAGESISTQSFDAPPTDVTGTYLFDPTATPTNGLIPPQDIRQWSGGSLVALPGCYWVISYPGTVIASPWFAYSSSLIHPTSWLPALRTQGMIKMDLTDVLGSGAAIPQANWQIGISQQAIWTGGAGVGQVVSSSFALATDSTGRIYTYLIRSSELNPVNTPYTIQNLDPGAGQAGPWYFTVPSVYTNDAGVYSSGTTYAANAVVRDPATDIPYISQTSGNVGNPLTDAVHWLAYAGENIVKNLVPTAPPGQIAYNQGIFSADSSVATGTYANPPVTLQDQLRQLTQIQARHVTASTDTATYDDDVLDLDGTSNTVTESLPSAIGWTKFLLLKCINITHTVTITTTGGQTIDGASSLTPALNVAYLLFSDGANWRIGATANIGGGGSASFSWSTKTANYTITTSDSGILADATSGALTITLPTAVAATQQYTIKKKDSTVFAVTVATTGGQTIDGQTTRVLAVLDAAITVESDGSNWYEVVPVAQMGVGAVGQMPGMVGGDPTWLSPNGLMGVAADIDTTIAEGDIPYRKGATTTSIQIGFIGDSITADVPSGGNAPPTNTVNTLATALNITVTAINRGVGSTSTSDWVSGNTNLVNAKAAFGGPAVTPIVSIALSVNDSDNLLRRTAAQVQANLQSTVNDLVQAGYLVVLHMPTYTIPGASAIFDGTSNTLQVAYQQAIWRLAKSRNVFLGDTSGYYWFQARPAQLQGDGIHPTATGSTNLGTLWAAGLQPLVAALTQQTTQARLPIGPGGTVLTSAGGYPAWIAPASATQTYDHNGTVVGSRAALNLVDGSNITLTVTDNPGAGRVDVTIAGPASTPASFTWASKTANYSMVLGDSGILADVSAGGITITLPSAASATAFYGIHKKDSTGNIVTVKGPSSQLINGAGQFLLTQTGTTILLASDTANWWEVASNAMTTPITNGNSANPLLVFNGAQLVLNRVY